MRPLLLKSFTRDFSLAIIELWWKGEVTVPKEWTSEKQLFYPYAVFEKNGSAVSGYYDHRGIDWVKKKLLEKVQEDKSFLLYVEEKVRENFGAIQAVYENEPVLPLSELRKFITQVGKSWIWFEAAWWLWEMEPQESNHLDIGKSLKDLRVGTQSFAAGSDATIRKSLSHLYPELAPYTNVILAEEIHGELPSVKELQKRQQGFYYTGGELFVGVPKQFVEDRFNITLESFSTDNITEIKGQVAWKGMAKGNVKVVNSIRELAKVNSGDILVSAMTLPDFLPAIEKASALVTDEGGIMCHAAIVAREMNKPCIIATKIATQALKDGDLVEVDAHKGIVKIL